MATWTAFTYDDPIRSYRRAMRWIPSGALKPAIIYCPGHGWNGRHPSELYDAANGDPFFLAQLEVKEGTNPVALFSMFSSSAAYDYTKPQSLWLTSTSYTQDSDLVKDSGDVIYRCIDSHTSDAAKQPGVGADWDHYWYIPDEQEISDHLILGARHSTPAFRQSNQLDLQALFAHVVENAAVYDVDPSLIFVMGSSAGGQAAGCFSFDIGDGYSTLDRPVLGNPYAATAKPKPAGVILRIAPDDLKWYPWTSLFQHLFGADLETPWDSDEIPDRRKSALSPLGVLRSTGDSIPTFLAYGGNGYFDPVTDEPPYSVASVHDARNGWQIFKHLVGTLAQADVTFVEDHDSLASTYNVWTTAGGILSADHTIPDTDEDDELWTWFSGLATP